MEYPRLVESHARAYLGSALAKAAAYKMTIYSWTFNIGIFLGLVIIIGLILYFKRKRPLSQHELMEREYKEQEYILGKIRQFQSDQKRQLSLITELPLTSQYKYDPDAGLDFPM